MEMINDVPENKVAEITLTNAKKPTIYTEATRIRILIPHRVQVLKNNSVLCNYPWRDVATAKFVDKKH